MYLLKQATVTNNEGVKLFACGNVWGAADAFQRAASLMRDCATDTNTTPANFSPTKDAPPLASVSSPSNPPLTQRPCYVQLSPTSSSSSSSNSTLATRDVIHVCGRPVVVPSAFHAPTSKEELRSMILITTAAVIFNFGLACHLMGKMQESLGEELLLGAQDLYETTLKLIGAHHKAAASAERIHSTSSSPTSVLIVLKCLSLNNLADLHYERCDYDDSEECLEAIHDMMDAQSEVLSLHIFEHELSSILFNVMYQRPPSAAAAA